MVEGYAQPPRHVKPRPLVAKRKCTRIAQCGGIRSIICALIRLTRTEKHPECVQLSPASNALSVARQEDGSEAVRLGSPQREADGL